jgi:hypothetical protein
MSLCVVALAAVAPFIHYGNKPGKGDLAYAASASMLLTILTLIILPFTLPTALNILGTGAMEKYIQKTIDYQQLPLKLPQWLKWCS